MNTKLIRDKIPEIVKSKGEEINVYIASEEEYNKKLLEKVLEEANEIVNSKNNEELKEEISDLYEVLDSILKNKSISKNEILEIQKQKKEKKWGFENRIILKY